ALPPSLARHAVPVRRPRLDIEVIGQQRRLTGAGLDDHRQTAVDQRRGRLRYQRDPSLIGAGLADHPDRRLSLCHKVTVSSPPPCGHCETYLNRYYESQLNRRRLTGTTR